MSFETRRYLAYFQRFAFVANVGASPELSAELRATLAEYPGHSGNEAFAFAAFADADAACARLEAEERAKRERIRKDSSAGPEASAAGTAGGTSDESDSSRAESEAEDEDELRENFEDSGSDADDDADDAVGDADDGTDVGGGAASDALEDSDSARSQSEENDASDDDASDDTSASESASESDSDERAGSSSGFSSDDSDDSDESETRDAKTFGGERSPPRNFSTPVASREDEARFEREMASFLGSAKREPRSVGDEKNDGKASSFAARGADARRGARGDSSRDAPRRVAFKALVRRDGRATAATVGIPEDASFVVRAREKQAAEARERAELKRLVLLSAEAAEAI